MNLFFYPDDSKILENWISISSSKYFQVVRIEKQMCPFFGGEKLRLGNFVLRYTDLYFYHLKILEELWSHFVQWRFSANQIPIGKADDFKLEYSSYEYGMIKVIIEKSRGEVSPKGQDTIENVS